MAFSRLWLLFAAAVVVQFAIWLYFIKLEHYKDLGITSASRFKRGWYVGCGELFMVLWAVIIWRRFTRLRNYMIENRFVHDVSTAFMIFVLFCSQFAFLFYYVMLSDEPRFVNIFFFVCWSLVSHLFSLLFLCVVVRGIAKFLNKRETGRLLLKPLIWVPPLQTLAFNANIQTAVVFILSLMLTARGFQIAHQPPVIHYKTIGIPRLPLSFNGTTIALLSDLHVGPTVGKSRVEKVVGMVNELNPDIVAIAGDLVDGDREILWRAVSPLETLKPKYGKYFVTGNHEYYHSEVDDWFDYLRSIGIQPLHNSNFPIAKLSGDRICMAGVDDWSAKNSNIHFTHSEANVFKRRVKGHTMNITEALKGCDPANDVTILLCHQPKGVKYILKRVRHIDLVLAGHTHGGQLLILAPLVWATQPYFLGHYVTEYGSQIYVSRGVHFWGPPVKNMGLEITLLTLVRGDIK